MTKYSPKDFEIYVAKVGTSYDPSSKGNDVSLAEQFDSAVGGATILTDFVKLADSNSISIDPAEDDSTTKKYLGSTAAGAQNSEAFVTVNPDVDITLSADPAIVEQLTPYILTPLGDTHIDYSNYANFNLGNSSGDEVVILIRIYKQVGTTYYYKNYVLVSPTFKKVDSLDISGDDEVATVEYTLIATKSGSYKDFYSATTKEVVTSIDN